MIRFARKFLILPIFLMAIAARPAFATIHYTISLEQPDKHLFAVRMEIPQASPGTTVALPAWNALYQVRDFSYRLRDLHVAPAENSNNSSANLRLIPLDKQTWTIGRNSSASAERPTGFRDQL